MTHLNQNQAKQSTRPHSIWKTPAKVAMLCALATSFHMNSHAQQSSTIGVQASFNVPVTINCGTSINFGTFSITSTTGLVTDSTIQVDPEFYANDQTVGGSVPDKFAAGDITLGQCTLQGVSGTDFAISSAEIDLTEQGGSSDTLAFTPMIKGTTLDTLNPSNLQVPIKFVDNNGTIELNITTARPDLTYSGSTLTVLVGGTLRLKKDISSAGELAGSYSGTANINVVL